MDENIVLTDVALMLSRNKSREWKQNIIRTETSLVKFLYDNNLLVKMHPFDDNGDLKLDTVIRKKTLRTKDFSCSNKELWTAGMII